MPKKLNSATVAQAFRPEVLKRVCEMDETEFAEAYGMVTVPVYQKAPDDFYCFRDNGSNILAVAHLDTVGAPWQRTAHFAETEAGLVVHSRALDDRLGAYIILELLPALGITHDILLTVGEESGRSTAQFFEPPEGKEYNWTIEFDRGGTDVVMYQYEDKETEALVKGCGAPVGVGSFTDICYLEHLEVKGFNWGVGYENYHGPRAHAYLEDTFSMVAKYLKFHEANCDTYLPHEEEGRYSWWSYGGGWSADDEQDDLECYHVFGYHDHDDEECERLLESMSIGVGRSRDIEDIDILGILAAHRENSDT